MLRETFDRIKERYGDSIRILMDRNGLIPGDDWNKELNLWLAECQAAIILVSNRALEKSDWIAKEMSILSWRKALDPDFIFIPITIQGESNPNDLESGFWKSLDIDRTTSHHAIERSAESIIDGIVRCLGGPQELSARCALTPLDRLRDAIAKLLSDEATATALEDALEDFEPTPSERLGCGLPTAKRYAYRLAEHMMQAHNDDAKWCFEAFERVLRSAPLLSLEKRFLLLEKLRFFWVDPGAAGLLAVAQKTKEQLVLCGRWVMHADVFLETEAYTLERYLQRAWPGENLCCIPIANFREVEQIRAEIRERILTKKGLPPDLTDSEIDDYIKNIKTIIVVAINASADQGGIPDPRQLRELKNLSDFYHKFILVFSSCASEEDLPEGVRAITPTLDQNLEKQAYLTERVTVTSLGQE
ncbi:toll/interleukin-1 receptor domain-containing protein [Marichromatium gracile]|uniref:toll/interleukin-1 receptor domain-containing protein n=1 Tax=Marichromatium gracile TaxID=1048 RepID=UPI001F3473E7|nr:toll/interleukin-1 receptor domain-containing protein [Marichromatium gracile]MCF1182440.1 toll/interleukin-1 receptor domain-containing protein [Marichromatium gracile]